MRRAATGPAGRGLTSRGMIPRGSKLMADFLSILVKIGQNMVKIYFKYGHLIVGLWFGSRSFAICKVVLRAGIVEIDANSLPSFTVKI